VIDKGHGFDVTGLAGEMPDPLSPRGRGVALMHTLIDEIDFNFEPAAGTIVRFVKVLTLTPDAALARHRRHARPDPYDPTGVPGLALPPPPMPEPPSVPALTDPIDPTVR
jgi:hypothetical protein